MNAYHTADVSLCTTTTDVHRTHVPDSHATVKPQSLTPPVCLPLFVQGTDDPFDNFVSHVHSVLLQLVNPM